MSRNYNKTSGLYSESQLVIILFITGATASTHRYI